MKMRVLITGATGYIGSRLAAECARCGDETHVIVRSTSDLRRLPSTIRKGNVHVFDGSLTSLLKAMSVAKPDTVIHLASLFVVHHEHDQAASLIESNVLFGTLLLEAMIANSVHRFINTGSSWQHFGSEEYNPTNLYAATKQAFEDVLKYYVEATPLRAITLQLPDTFGPNDSRRKIVNILIESVRSQTPLDLTPGEQLLDLVHVDDLVEAFRMVMGNLGSREDKNAVYSLSSGRPIKLKELVACIESFSPTASRFHLGARPYRFREVMTAWDGGIALPGWRATRRIEDFLKEQIVGAQP